MADLNDHSKIDTILIHLITHACLFLGGPFWNVMHKEIRSNNNKGNYQQTWDISFI